MNDEQGDIPKIEYTKIEGENIKTAKGLLEKYPDGVRGVILDDGSQAAVFDCKLIHQTKGAESFYPHYQEDIPGFDGSDKQMFLENNGRSCFVFSKHGMSVIKRKDGNLSYLEMSDDQIKETIKKLQDRVRYNGQDSFPTTVEIDNYEVITYYKGLLDTKLNRGFLNPVLGTMLRAIDNLAREERLNQKTAKDILDNL